MPKTCTICGKPVILQPSAEERARKFGGKASDYTAVFPVHAGCLLSKRRGETMDLLRKTRGAD